MNSYKALFFLSIFCLITLSSMGATIIANLKPKQVITLFYGGDSMCRLINSSEKDSTIVKEIVIGMATEFRYSVGFRENGKLKRNRYTFLLLPNDLIEFAKVGNDLQPINEDARRLFLFKSIQSGFYAIEESPVVNIQNKVAFDSYLRKEVLGYKKDSILIDSLSNSRLINSEIKQKWMDFRRMTFVVKVLQSSEGAQIFNSKIYKDLFDEGLELSITSNINGDLVSLMFKTLAKFWIKRQNEINTFKKVDFIDFYIENIHKINKQYIQDAFSKYIKNTPKKSSEVYINNLSRIKSYAISNDVDMLQRYFQPKEFDPASVELLSTKNLNVTMRDVLSMTSRRYVLIDVWASWCLPCKEQMPVFEKYKKKFTETNILFVNISTDKIHENWIKALNEAGINQDPFQFRLKDEQQSYFKKYFEINTIPRYLILDQLGGVVNDRFYLPTDNEFESELRKLIL